MSGPGAWIIDSSIWVAITTGLPARRASRVICFCRLGTRSSGNSTPRSPRVGAIGLVMYVAWFASLVRSTALRLLPGPLRALPARLAYCAWNLAGMALGAAAAFAVSGSPGLLLIGAGAGLAAAWILFLAGRAWRYLGQAGPPTGASRGT